MPVSPFPTGSSPTAVGPSSIQGLHAGPSGISSTIEPAAPSEELPGLQQYRDGNDMSTVGASAGATTTQDMSTQVAIPRTGSGEDSKVETHEYATLEQNHAWLLLGFSGFQNPDFGFKATWSFESEGSL
jgi:hypothetical protein